MTTLFVSLSLRCTANRRKIHCDTISSTVFRPHHRTMAVDGLISASHGHYTHRVSSATMTSKDNGSILSVNLPSTFGRHFSDTRLSVTCSAASLHFLRATSSGSPWISGKSTLRFSRGNANVLPRIFVTCKKQNTAEWERTEKQARAG